jgi:hypothetical protein
VVPYIQVLADIQAGNLDAVRAENRQHMAAVAFSVMDRLSQGIAAGVRQPSLVVTSLRRLLRIAAVPPAAP